MIPINEKGRLPDQLPLFRGHTAVVLDTDWYDVLRFHRRQILLNGPTGALSMIRS